MQCLHMAMIENLQYLGISFVYYCHILILRISRCTILKAIKMYVKRVKQRQAANKVNRASEAADSLSKPLGGWIATFQEAIGMNTPALARRLGITRNSAYSSIQNECSGSISLNQLDKMAKAMGGKLVYAIVPLEGPVEEIVEVQARKKAKPIILRARAHMALEGQADGLRSPEEMIEELATDMMREMRRDFWS